MNDKVCPYADHVVWEYMYLQFQCFSPCYHCSGRAYPDVGKYHKDTRHSEGIPPCILEIFPKWVSNLCNLLWYFYGKSWCTVTSYRIKTGLKFDFTLCTCVQCVVGTTPMFLMNIFVFFYLFCSLPMHSLSYSKTLCYKAREV